MYKYFVTAITMMVFGSTAFMSVSALTSAFSNNIPLMITLGTGIELGKIMVIVHLHRRWKEMEMATRAYYILVVVVLIILTTFEALGYLALNHATVTASVSSTHAELAALDSEKLLLEKQLATIDKTLAELPPGYVTRKLKERKKAGYGEKQERLLEIARKTTALSVSVHESRHDAGPLSAVASIMGVEEAKVAFAFMIVLVLLLEPLSLGLTIASDTAWSQPVKKKRAPAKKKATPTAKKKPAPKKKATPAKKKPAAKKATPPANVLQMVKGGNQASSAPSK